MKVLGLEITNESIGKKKFRNWVWYSEEYKAKYNKHSRLQTIFSIPAIVFLIMSIVYEAGEVSALLFIGLICLFPVLVFMGMANGYKEADSLLGKLIKEGKILKGEDDEHS